jgi:hypothetical protein
MEHVPVMGVDAQICVLFTKYSTFETWEGVAI